MKGTENQTIFVIDTLHKYSDKDKIRQVFQLNGRWFSILETELEWGHPCLTRFDDDDEIMPFHIYSTLEEAQEFVKTLKKLEGMKL